MSSSGKAFVKEKISSLVRLFRSQNTSISYQPKPVSPKPVGMLRNIFVAGQEKMGAETEEFLAVLDLAKAEFATAAQPDLVLKLEVLKAVNLLVNKHEYLKFAVRKVGRPSGFMLDTINACQLGCAACPHSYNKEYTSAHLVPTPVGTMQPDAFEMFIRAIGLRSYAGHFYNKSEPFLNRKTPQYLRTANQYRIQTMISSNMSIPRLDAEAIVDSGLNLLMTAIDGTTQDIYQRYRRGGHLDLVLENVRRIVEAKRRLNSPTPLLRWQFLTFKHNVHQVDEAIELAKQIGYDTFNVATPYDVSGDDPTIHVAEHPKAGTDVVFKAGTPSVWRQSLEPIRAEIESAFSESLVDRYSRSESLVAGERTRGHCDWLHLGIISDALGRIHPCCLPDYKSQGSFVFGTLDASGGNVFNSDEYLRARLLFASESAYEATRQGGLKQRSKCEGCTYRPLPQIGLGAIGGYFQSEPQPTWFNEPLMREILLGWSRHDEALHS